MKGTVVFDFDDTLADTVAFKRALAEGPEAEVLARMRAFVFPQAASVLARLRDDGWTLALLTFGDPAWQRGKLERSGLLPYFDHATYTSEPKERRVDLFAGWPAPIIFVNDHGAELDALKSVMPDAVMIAVRGPKALPRDAAIPVCEGLEQVYNIVSNL